MNVSAATREVVAGEAAGLPPGGRVILDFDGRSVGVFNVAGRFFALNNRCPHSGGPLCLGPITGTALPTTEFKFVYGRQGSILRCAWHGWEFDIETGQALADPRYRAKTFPVTVENGNVVVHV
ncbi:MAG: Rieske (2Fe-2S) protein [Chloroflexi bacterium]|nr:Rieske (2Fe-2S) protein [Chloroflexota bacterium]